MRAKLERDCCSLPADQAQQEAGEAAGRREHLRRKEREHLRALRQQGRRPAEELATKGANENQQQHSAANKVKSLLRFKKQRLSCRTRRSVAFIASVGHATRCPAAHRAAQTESPEGTKSFLEAAPQRLHAAASLRLPPPASGAQA